MYECGQNIGMHLSEDLTMIATASTCGKTQVRHVEDGKLL